MVVKVPDFVIGKVVVPLVDVVLNVVVGDVVLIVVVPDVEVVR
jgi:hypothetical protein